MPRPYWDTPIGSTQPLKVLTIFTELTIEMMN